MRFLVLGLLAACTGPRSAPEPPSGVASAPADAPAEAPVAPPPAASAFPPFEPVRALPPLVANVSQSECVVVWPAETDYRASFVFSTADGGRTFQAWPELVGTAVAATSAGRRVFVLQEYVGGGVLPEIVATDDLGATWSGHGAVERVVREHKTSESNQLDLLAFLDERTGRARWNGERWLVTADGGATWSLVAEEPAWVAPAPADGPCRAREGALERRTATSWEPVPGAPLP